MYRKVIKSDSSDFRLIGNLATVLYYTDKRDSASLYYKQAIDLAKQTLTVNPSDADVICTLAGYYAQIGERDLAYVYLNKAQKTGVTNVDTYFDIGDVYEQLGNRDLALKWIEKAIDNGFTLAKIENNPALEQLRKDKRFQDLIKSAQSPN